jgi:2'-5' RNA ligase
MKQTLPIEKARELAEKSGLESLVARVDKAEADGWQVITLEAIPDGHGGWDIGAAAPTSVMVAWFLRQWEAESVAIPGGEAAAELHITLAYLGAAAELTLDQQRRLTGVVGEVAMSHYHLQGQLRGTGRFSNGEDTDPYWVGVEIPGLKELRADLVTALVDAGYALKGIGDTNKEYTPHVTVAYIPADAETPPMDFRPIDVTIDSLTVCVGPNQFKLSLQEPARDYDEYAYNPGGWAPAAITKALDQVEEERYTLAPWYIPDRLDAHGEWTDTRELQKTFHGYLAKEDRSIRLQHNTDIVAGRWADGVVWPVEFTTTLTKADGTQTEHTFPAGTPYLGVYWEPWAWELIKAGKLRGYSIGGSSSRMLVDLPGPKGD